MKIGKFRTFSKKLETYSFVASSCATLMSSSDAFNQISSMNPEFFINVGDMHYSASNRSSKEHFVFAYHEVFKSNAQRALYQNTPLVYTFDDHEVGDNNADAHAKSSAIVNQAYRVISRF
jgi:phosphodiesterase/alkaline phosphatase D-like protein